MRLESGGLVASLFKVDDTYSSRFTTPGDSHFCTLSTRLESMEGQRHHEAQVTYDRAANRAHYIERDLNTNQTLREMQRGPAPLRKRYAGGPSPSSDI